MLHGSGLMGSPHHVPGSEGVSALVLSRASESIYSLPKGSLWYKANQKTYAGLFSRDACQDQSNTEIPAESLMGIKGSILRY